MKKFVIGQILVFCISCVPFATGLVRAQDCDEECFIINNTYGQETLKRFLRAFPNSKHAEDAKRRIEYIGKISSHQPDNSMFPAPTMKKTTQIPASQVPTNTIGRK